MPLIEPHQYAGARDEKSAIQLSTWLLFMCGLVALMVTVGGATRLTDSGLSITQWDLIIGALPPFGNEGWLAEFEKYKQIPEYELVNKGMSLGEFKAIYWWEWGHRNLGRFIGLAFLFPMIWFLVRGSVQSTSLKIKLVGVFLLICAQGALGWYMVSSGLVERVDVSQYRLAAHLGLAIILFAFMLWLALDLRRDKWFSSLKTLRQNNGLAVYGWVLIAFIFIQITLGAFVAGLRAGSTYNTWPLMDGRFFPEGYFQGKADFLHAFETIAAVQFNHRVGAYLLLVFAGFYGWKLFQAGEAYKKPAMIIPGLVFLQACLGIWTLIAAVPINLGLAHQLGALAVLSAALYTQYKLLFASR